MKLLLRFYDKLDQWIKPGAVLILYGPRRVGKTTLLKNYLNQINQPYLLVNGDNLSVQAWLSSQEETILKAQLGTHRLLVIDEAQNIPNVGQSLKILVDSLPDLKIIATGSSSFELAGQVGEPLVGRKTTLTIFPISTLEMSH